MLGWRLRIGLVLPYNNTIIEPELNAAAPDGVTIHAARLRTRDLEEMPADGAEAVATLDEMGADVIVYACNLSSFVDGPDGNERIEDSLAKATDVPVFTASTAVLAALEELSVASVAIVSPYQEHHDELLVAFLEQSGVEVRSIQGLGVSASDDVSQLAERTAEMTYQRALDVDSAGADAVLIAATDMISLDALSSLESDLGRPALSSNQAILWHCLETGGVNARIEGYGSLLS